MEVDEHRRRNLEMIFANVKDEDLISELVRRRRLDNIQGTMMFYNEFTSDPLYMEHIERDVAQMVARGIYAQGLLTFEDRPTSGEVTARVGHVFVLKEKDSQ